MAEDPEGCVEIAHASLLSGLPIRDRVSSDPDLVSDGELASSLPLNLFEKEMNERVDGGRYLTATERSISYDSHQQA
jgi:hypothetical protein